MFIFLLILIFLFILFHINSGKQIIKFDALWIVLKFKGNTLKSLLSKTFFNWIPNENILPVFINLISDITQCFLSYKGPQSKKSKTNIGSPTVQSLITAVVPCCTPRSFLFLLKKCALHFVFLFWTKKISLTYFNLKKFQRF